MSRTIITNENIRDLVDKYINEKRSLPSDLRNIPIGNWDVIHVTNMSSLFFDESDFNEPLNNWNVGNVTNMNSMFHGASRFNQPLNRWNVSSVLIMNSMFEDASAFNQPLNSWNVGNVTDISQMFSGASAFNQNLDTWDVHNVRYANDAFEGSSMRNLPQWYIEIQEQPDRLRRRLNHDDDPSSQESDTVDANFPECVICLGALDNIHGPGRTTYCTVNCNDAVRVCQRGDIVHRGCILQLCNSAPIGSREKCPVCQKPLSLSCNEYRSLVWAPAITENELKQYKRERQTSDRQNAGKYRKRRYSRGKRSNTKKKRTKKNSKTRRIGRRIKK